MCTEGRIVVSLRASLHAMPAIRHAYAYSFLLKYMRARLRSQTSFAQEGEDLLIEALFPDVHFFIDLGTNDGISGSNTFYFELRGAKGICFDSASEPYCELRLLCALRRDMVCRNIAVSNRDAETKIVAAHSYSFLPETEDRAPLSISKGWPFLTTKPQPGILWTFLQAMVDIPVPSTVVLLSIDVERHELNILRSIPFNKFTFPCIMVETSIDIQGKRIWQHRTLSAINALLADLKYKALAATMVNTLYAPA
jgi:FkbM family methyltransferase